MCWSEQFRYDLCGHYIRKNSPCPTQKDSHRYEPDWLTECQMFDCQPAQHRPGFCGRCDDFHLARYAHDLDEASNSDIDRSSRATRNDTAGTNSHSTSNSANSFTPPASDYSDDSYIPWQYRPEGNAISDQLPQTLSASNLSYDAAEMRNSAPPAFHRTPIDYGHSLRSTENRKTSQGYHDGVRRTQERLARALGLTRMRVHILMLNAQDRRAQGGIEAANNGHVWI